MIQPRARYLIDAMESVIGVFYTVPLGKWTLFSTFANEHGNHFNFWREEVLPYLEEHYGVLTTGLQHAYRSLPRGRVIQNGLAYEVYTGFDFDFNRTEVDRRFAIEGKSNWRPDKHETVLCAHKQALLKQIPIKKTWECENYAY